jgi:hypothetical protein
MMLTIAQGALVPINFQPPLSSVAQDVSDRRSGYRLKLRERSEAEPNEDGWRAAARAPGPIGLGGEGFEPPARAV